MPRKTLWLIVLTFAFAAPATGRVVAQETPVEAPAPATAAHAPAPAAVDPELARREAEAAAWLDLYRRVTELQLTPDRRVADLLAIAPQTRAMAWDALRAGARVGQPRTFSDGATAVQVHLAVQQVVDRLKELCASPLCDCGPFRGEAFDQVLLYTEHDTLWGMGVSFGRPRLALADPAPVGWYDVGVFGRLEARRLATENAYAKLLARIDNLRFSPTQRVSAFAESDPRVARLLETFVRARSTMDDLRYLPERICEVDLQVRVADLVTELRSLATAYATEPQFAPDQFDALTTYEVEPILKVTGVAVPEPPPEAPAAEQAEDDLWSCTSEAAAPENVDDPQQALVMARQAAVARCRESLRQRLLALPAPGSTDESPQTVAQWLTGHAPVRQDIDTLLGMLRLVRSEQLLERRVRITAELPVERFFAILAAHGAEPHEPPAPAED